MPLTKDGEKILAEYKTIYGVNGQTVFYSECLQNDGMANGKLCVVENCSGSGGVATEVDEEQPRKKKKRSEDKPGQLILGDKVMEDETKEELDRIWGLTQSEQLYESAIDETKPSHSEQSEAINEIFGRPIVSKAIAEAANAVDLVLSTEAHKFTDDEKSILIKVISMLRRK